LAEAGVLLLEGVELGLELRGMGLELLLARRDDLDVELLVFGFVILEGDVEIGDSGL
jgi:hypothetical protein